MVRYEMLDWNDILNGLVAEGLAMIVEISIIVKLLDWLRKRDDNRRLSRYRIRVRKLLRRSLTQLDSQLSAVRKTVQQYEAQIGPSGQCKAPLPPPVDTAQLVSAIQHDHERLGRDYALYLPNLDDATSEIFEAWLEQMEWMLSVWPIWRMTNPSFAERWKTDDEEERQGFAGHLPEIDGAIRETALVASSINASLLYAESQKGGDEKLLREAKKFRDGIHVLSRARDWKSTTVTTGQRD